MSTLTLNGLEFPVARDGLKVPRFEKVGDDGAAVDGSAWSSVSKVKRVWSARSARMAKATAEAWASWLAGGTLHFPFDADFYSTDGQPIATNPTSLAEIVTDVKKYGAGSLLVAEGGAPTWATGVGSTWTVGAWRRETGTFYYYVVRSDGVVYKNGADQGTGGLAGKIHISSGTLTLYGDSGDRWYDDVVVVPFLVPIEWITGATGPWSYSGAAVYPSAPPLFTMAGDAVPSVSTLPSVNNADLVYYAGEYQELAVELREA